MTWQRFVGPALLFSVLAGCESSAPTLARNQFLQDPELMALINRNGAQGAESSQAGTLVSRGQKPDIRQTSSLLDIPPDRPADVSNSQPAIKIRAIVNNQAILDEEVRASAYGELLRASYLPDPERRKRSAEIFNEALNRIVEREIVLQYAFDLITHGGKDQKNLNKLREAAREQFDKQVIDGVKKANKFKTDAEVKHYFNEMGVSLASVRRQWERNFMEFEFLRSRIFPLLETRINHQAIVEYYDRHPEEFQVTDNVKWLDLFVSYAKHGSREEARAHAESLLDQARKGGDFVKMVKQYDDGDSSLRNGEGVGAKRGEINPVEAETVLFKLDDGQVGDIIELPTGCHIVKMVHHQLAGQLPFDEKVQKQIRDKLRNQFYEREKKQIITELRRNAVVEYARSVN